MPGGNFCQCVPLGTQVFGSLASGTNDHGCDDYRAVGTIPFVAASTESDYIYSTAAKSREASEKEFNSTLTELRDADDGQPAWLGRETVYERRQNGADPGRPSTQNVEEEEDEEMEMDDEGEEDE